MGLFSGDTIVTVASVVYNLAGDFATRPNYLKSLIARNIVSNSTASLGTVINDGLVSGPGARFRHFPGWAKRTGYDALIGLNASVVNTGSVDNTALAAVIDHPVGETVSVQFVDIGRADFTHWAEQHIIENAPMLLNTAWVADFIEGTGQIKIVYADTTEELFTPAGYDPQAFYLTVGYLLVRDATGSKELKYLIYKKNNGNTALDAFFITGSNLEYFFPYIPIRLNNSFISKTFYPNIYTQSKKALSRATGVNYDDIVTKLSDNSSLSDIDYAYIVFGVALNAKDKHSKKYMYAFFKQLAERQVAVDPYEDWVSAMTAYYAALDLLHNWVPPDEYGGQGTPPPEPKLPVRPKFSIALNSSSQAVMNYDTTISWVGIKESTGLGLKKLNGKVGELWFEINAPFIYVPPAIVTRQGTFTQPNQITENITLYWQETTNSWRSLKISGLVHKNRIYSQAAVITTAISALNSTNESPFIVPIHEGVCKSLPMVSSTQMALSGSFLVLNCYVVVQQPWYTSFEFQFVLFVFQAYVASPFTAFVTYAVMRLISVIAIELFGEKLGGIIIAVVNLIIVANGAFDMASMVESFSNMQWAENIMKLTMAVGDGITAYLKSSAYGVLHDMQDMLAVYAGKMQDVQRMYDKNFGYAQGIIDPLAFTDSSNNASNITLEAPSNFLTRTLMTGMDVAEMSNSLLGRMSELTISTKLPT